jgi:hypothetical protein
MAIGDVYWSEEHQRFMVVQPVGARSATHPEIKRLVDDALRGWRDLLADLDRLLGEPGA